MESYYQQGLRLRLGPLPPLTPPIRLLCPAHPRRGAASRWGKILHIPPGGEIFADLSELRIRSSATPILWVPEMHNGTKHEMGRWGESEPIWWSSNAPGC